MDPAEGPWRARHGSHGALSSIADPTGAETGFSYDAYGNVVEIAGADGRVYAQGFDGLSQLVSVTDPGGSTWSYEHDPEGELVAIVEPTGVATRRVVDLLGRTPTFAPALRVVIPVAAAVAIVASVGLRAAGPHPPATRPMPTAPARPTAAGLYATSASLQVV